MNIASTAASRPASAEDVKVGDRVEVDLKGPGRVLFVGPTKFKEGEWYGVELDGPGGKHDGSFEGFAYVVSDSP